MTDRMSLNGLDPGDAPDDYVLVVRGGQVTTAAATGPGAAVTAYREVLMATGVTPPEPLVSSDNTDWLYGEA